MRSSVLANAGVPICLFVRVIWQTRCLTRIRLRYLRCPLTRLDVKPARLSVSLHGAAYCQSLRNGDSFPTVRSNLPSGIFQLQIDAKILGGAPLAPPSYSCLPLGASGCASIRRAAKETRHIKFPSSAVGSLAPDADRVGSASSMIRYRCPTAERSSRSMTRQASSPRANR